MAGSDAQGVLRLYGACFAKRLTELGDTLTRDVVESLAHEIPELLGPDPRLRPLAIEIVLTDLKNVTAVLAGRVPVGSPSIPLAVAEHARLLARLGISSNSLLRGHQLQERISIRRLVECGAAVVDNRDDLALLVDAALACMFACGDAVIESALAAYFSVRGALPVGTGLGLSPRVDAVLEGSVTDLVVAEHMLGYRLAAHHVAVVVWFDDSLGRPPDMLAADRRLRTLPGVWDALIVPKDEHTLRCWLSVSDTAATDEWIEIARGLRQARRVAFGEPEMGLEGFRLSHAQALAAGAVLAAARPEAGSVARYRDVSTISFMVDHPTEATRWVGEILGDLAGPGAEWERLRRTLHVFLQEGEDAVATGRRLFVHRNTVRYRLDQARRSLPHGFAHRRLDVALALRYCEWIPLFEVAGARPRVTATGKGCWEPVGKPSHGPEAAQGGATVHPQLRK
jgi:hypothetical protein